MAGTAFDSSAIVPALLSWHDHHARARPVLSAALRDGDGVILPLPALFEAYSVMTRLPPPGRLQPQEAWEALSRTFQARARVVSVDGAQAWTVFAHAARERIGGGVIHDAHIAACVRAAGASRLVTFNARHFARLDLGGAALVVPA